MSVPYCKPFFMKPTLLLGCALLAGTALHAQFSLLPYAGFEQSRNLLRYGNGFSASDINGNVKAGLRADYRLKGGHSPFVNLTTSPAPVNFSFNKAGSLANNYETVKNNLQFRLEAGYQYSSKPIQFRKQRNSSRPTSFETTSSNTGQKKSCGSRSYSSGCGSKSRANTPVLVNNNLNMRLQPSVALAYIPSSVQTVKQTANGFDYTAGAWKTALVPAMGFEFAKGSQRLFTLTAFYTKPLHQSEEIVNTQIEGKSIATALQPRTSTWGLTFGVPIQFTKSKAPKAQTRTEKKSCNRTSYRSSCLRLN